jgi:2-amino-4-hydroxy-6-hydroxymethyldihydropteridine diphosphokinase
MILLGLGGNLPIAGARSPVDNLEAALTALVQEGVGVPRRSRWYRTAPIADEPQPWYVNGVAELDTGLSPHALMTLLLAVERRLGRVRSVANAPHLLMTRW